MNWYSRGRLADMLLIEHDYLEYSKILSWRIVKYGKIIFNGLFQKRSFFPKN